MTRSHCYWPLLLSLLLTSPACTRQVKTNIPPEAVQPKIRKNHFLPQYPETYFFVQCGLEDHAGNMWFGSAGNGIYRYDGNNFVNFNHTTFINFSLKEDLNHSDILCCLEDKNGNIWFGTRRGLIRYKPSGAQAENRDFSLFLIPENTTRNTTRSRLPYTFKTGDNFVWSILQDKSGILWFGTSTGVYIHNPSSDYDQDTPLFRRFLDNDSLLNSERLQLPDISTMLQDRNGSIWFASAWSKGEGIIRYDGKSLRSFTPDSIRSFRSILERKNGDLLFLSPFQGLYRFDGTRFSNFSEQAGIPRDTLVCMLEDPAGRLWLGHSSARMEHGGAGGLWCYDGKTLKQYSTQDGLSHNHVFCMVADRNGNIWFGTRNTGLCRFDGKRFVDFTE